MVNPDGLPLRVGDGDHGGHVVECGDGVQAFGEQPEPLSGDRVLAEEAFRAVLHPGGGLDAPLRGKVAALGVWFQAAQVVVNRVHQAACSELRQPAAQGGGGNPAEGRQFLGGRQGRGAQQRQGVLQGLGQGFRIGRRRGAGSGGWRSWPRPPLLSRRGCRQRP